MNCMNISKTWLPLSRQAFEAIVDDQQIQNHCKIYVKYLKILRNLEDYDALLKSALQMLEIYPNEYIPLDMVCMTYVNKYHHKDFDFQVSRNEIK